MPRTLQFKRYANTVVANITGASGEIIIDTTNKLLTIHDGVTPGGSRFSFDNVARTVAFSAQAKAQAAFDYSNTTTNIDQTARTTANTASNNITILQGINPSQNVRLDYSNSVITIIQGTDISQNARISVIENALTPAYHKANTNISSDLTLFVTNSGASAYLIDGSSNPTLTLYRGVTYYFNINASGHPFYIQTVNGAYSSGDVYTLGVSGNGMQVGTLTFTVPLNAPSSLYYVCQNHSMMGGGFLIENLISTINTRKIPQNAQSTNYALQLTDAGKHIYYTQASNTILYIPTTANVTFSNGTTIMVVSRTSSSANVTVTPNTGVTMFLAGNTTSASRNVTSYGVATLMQVAANTWFIDGTGVS
jgi:hypothetical protein